MISISIWFRKRLIKSNLTSNRNEHCSFRRYYDMICISIGLKNREINRIQSVTETNPVDYGMISIPIRLLHYDTKRYIAHHLYIHSYYGNAFNTCREHLVSFSFVWQKKWQGFSAIFILIVWDYMDQFIFCDKCFLLFFFRKQFYYIIHAT